MNKQRKSEDSNLRKKAEEILKRKPSKSGLPLSESETMKLIHELEVHQIELEMQYDELLLAKKQASDSARGQYAETAKLLKTTEKLTKEISDRILAEEKLVEQTQELEKFHFRLEELVKERTAELESNNFKLAKEIIDRRQAEKALTESERKFREIAQNVPGMIFQLRVRPDGSNYFNYMSPRSVEIFDVPQELINLEWSLIDQLHPDDKEGFLSSIARVINDKEDWDFEGRVRKTNGEIKWFQGLTSPTYVGDELVLDGIMLDITERKMAEKALMESENKYRTLFSSMTEAFMLCEMIFDKKNNPVDYKLLEINDACEIHTGIKIEIARGKTIKEILPDIETTFLKRYGDVVTTGIPAQFEDYNISTRRYYSIYCFKTQGNRFGVIYSDISSRKVTEEELETTLKKYRALFDCFPQGLTVCDEKGKIIESNKEAERLLGISREVQAERDIDSSQWQIIRPDGRIMLQKEYASVRALKTGKLVENVEMGILKTEGDITWINVTAAPIHLKNYGVIITYGDITQRKNAETALRESEKRYRALFDSMTEGFALHEIICNDKGKPVDYYFLDINAAFEKLTGLKRESVIGKKFSELLPDEDPKWVKFYGKVALTGKSVSFENYSQVLDRHYEVHAYCPLARQFAVIFRDITSQKKMEAVLLENEGKFKELAESISDVYFAMDKNLRYTYWNSGSEKVTGIPAKDALGKTIFDLFPDSPELRESVRRYQIVLKERKPKKLINTIILEGKTHYFEITINPSKNGLSVLAIDVSGFKEMEQKIKLFCRKNRKN